MFLVFSMIPKYRERDIFLVRGRVLGAWKYFEESEFKIIIWAWISLESKTLYTSYTSTTNNQMKCQNSKIMCQSLKFKATQLQSKKTIFNWIPFLCSDVRFISLLWCTLHPIWKSMGFSSINLQSQYSNGFYQLESNWYLHQFKPLRQIGPQV